MSGEQDSPSTGSICAHMSRLLHMSLGFTAPQLSAEGTSSTCVMLGGFSCRVMGLWWLTVCAQHGLIFSCFTGNRSLPEDSYIEGEREKWGKQGRLKTSLSTITPGPCDTCSCVISRCHMAHHPLFATIQGTGTSITSGRVFYA